MILFPVKHAVPVIFLKHREKKGEKGEQTILFFLPFFLYVLCVNFLFPTLRRRLRLYLPRIPTGKSFFQNFSTILIIRLPFTVR